MRSPRSTTAVLLDIDGTLVDSTYHHAMAWQRSFARQGLTVPLWRIHRSIGMGGDKLVAHVAGDEVERDLGDEVRQGWREEYAAIVDTVPPLPGAVDLVHRLARDGFAIGLASSGEAEFSEKAIAILGVGELVAATTSSDDAEESKPEPDILLATLEKLGDVDLTVAVGDTPYDVEAAARIGLRCVAVLSGGYSREELTSAGAALVVEEPAELVELDWLPHLSTPDLNQEHA
jgi:HAD superfamily hydrolase (TIGR01549 family)